MSHSLPVCHRKEKTLSKLLSRLSAVVPLYIITDTTRENCIKSLEGAGYNLLLFKEIITLDDVANPKPNLEGYQKIGVKKGFVIFGDQQSDIEPAVALGAEGIIVKSRREMIANLRKMEKNCSDKERTLTLGDFTESLKCFSPKSLS